MVNKVSSNKEGLSLKSSLDSISLLSEREEQLLCRFYDRECGFIGKIFAARLLRNKKSATDFVMKLSRISHKHKSVENDQRNANFGKGHTIWEKVEQRILQEEHAARFLGTRPKMQPAAAMPVLYGLRWGMGGAVLAASLALFIAPSFIGNNSGSFSQGQLVASNASPSSSSGRVSRRNTHGVAQGFMPTNSSRQFQAAGSEGSQTLVADTREYGKKPVELDWVRSRGSVRLVEQSGSAPIIWVNKRSPINSLSARNSGLPSYLSENEAAREQGVVIYNQRLPNTVGAVNSSSR